MAETLPNPTPVVVVPVEPTEAMLMAPDEAGVGLYSRDVFARIYRAMLAARPAALTQSAAQTGHLHTAIMDALRSEIMRQNPKACSEETEGDMILPIAVPAGAECAYAPLDLSALAEAVLLALSKLEPSQ